MEKFVFVSFDVILVIKKLNNLNNFYASYIYAHVQI